MFFIFVLYLAECSWWVDSGPFFEKTSDIRTAASCSLKKSSKYIASTLLSEMPDRGSSTENTQLDFRCPRFRFYKFFIIINLYFDITFFNLNRITMMILVLLLFFNFCLFLKVLYSFIHSLSLLFQFITKWFYRLCLHRMPLCNLYILLFLQWTLKNFGFSLLVWFLKNMVSNMRWKIDVIIHFIWRFFTHRIAHTVISQHVSIIYIFYNFFI